MLDSPFFSKRTALWAMAALLTGCAPRVKSAWFEPPPPPVLAEKNDQPVPRDRTPKIPKKAANACCNDYHFAIPDEARPAHFPKKYLRLQIHVMDSTSGTQNFRPDSAIAFITEIVDEANKSLRRNTPNWLPRPTTGLAMPIGFEYVRPTAADFHFHRDDRLYFYVFKGRDQNNYDREILKKYNTGGDSAINLFFMPHHPDSQRTATYPPNKQGIALGNNVKMAGVFEARHEGPRAFRGLLNHEVGHVLGLSHAWVPDGCEDTPEHKQKCWAYSDQPPCDMESSNNVMDYNAHQEAWTPCQIGRALLGLSNPGSVPRLALRPDWCANDLTQKISVRDTVVWNCQKDLNGPLRVAPGGSLTIRCRVSMPPGSEISVAPGGRLVLDNCRIHQACGKTWRGIEVEKIGAKSGLVEALGQPVLEDVERRGRSKKRR